MRPLRPACGTVLKAQLLSLPGTISASAPGVVTAQLSHPPPASSSATEVLRSSESRPATAQPPEPPPTTTKSNVSVTLDPPKCLLLFTRRRIARSKATKQSSYRQTQVVDCFVEPLIGRACARPIGSQ